MQSSAMVQVCAGFQLQWESKLTGDVLLVVGGEHYGIPEEILSISDQIIRIPMAGFVPSYNLQAPMAIMAAEALRQRSPFSNIN